MPPHDGGLAPEHRELPTPCADYTVHELVEHLLGSVRALGAIAGAEMPDDIDAPSAEDYVAQATESALAAWRERGTDGDVPFGDGTAPATVPIGILGIEFYVHAWDFARAIDEPFTAPVAADSVRHRTRRGDHPARGPR